MNQNLIRRIFKGYQLLDTLDTDPGDSVCYGFTTSNTIALCQAWTISPDSAMELNPKVVIDGIHHSLAPNQALIEVDCGKTASGKNFIYSIVKTLKEPHGVQYFVMLHFWENDNSILNLQGFFDETGKTGFRDSMIFAVLCGHASHEEVQSKWWFDPYDDSFEHPALMNLSEKVDFDEMFPEHPLSLARNFISRIVNE